MASTSRTEVRSCRSATIRLPSTAATARRRARTSGIGYKLPPEGPDTGPDELILESRMNKAADDRSPAEKLEWQAPTLTALGDAASLTMAQNLAVADGGGGSS